MRPRAGIGRAVESHMELGCWESHMDPESRGEPRGTARDLGVGKARGNESPEGRRLA